MKLINLDHFGELLNMSSFTVTPAAWKALHVVTSIPRRVFRKVFG